MKKQIMQRINMSKPGGPEVLYIEETERPQPKQNELLIKVAYAGVNRPDIMQRQGLYPMPKGVTPIMGLELSGEVIAIGEDVTSFQVGDLVCALADGGAYAEYCTVPASQALLIPAGFSLLEAAALPETYFTVWANLFMHKQVKEKESLLIHGGTSGIGIATLTIAKALGIKTYATCGSDEKKQVIEELGGIAINYKTENFVNVIQQTSPTQGVDAILDVVGANYFQQNINVLNKDGRLFLIGFMGGSVAEAVDLLQIAVKRLTITGSTMRGRTQSEKAEITQSLLQEIWDKLATNQINKPIIHKTFHFSDVQQAHQEIDKGTHIGKIMLEFNSQ